MSMTERREPRERPDRLANRNHSLATQPRHGDQPLPLDNSPSIWATYRSSEVLDAASPLPRPGGQVV